VKSIRIAANEVPGPGHGKYTAREGCAAGQGDRADILIEPSRR
jgi:hypothetical protein